MTAPAPALVDTDALARWMDAEGLAPGVPLRVERVTTGHSNEVFRVERGDHQWALRRPPRTPLSPTAHDMAREFRLISAFRDPRGWPDHAPVPVAEPVALCTDTDVIGAPFYLMEHLDGVVVRERVPAPLSDTATAGADCAFAMMDALAGIHAFAWEAGGLGDYGRPDGYLERQVPRWLGQLERYRTRDLPEVDEAGRWLQTHTPTMKEATVIHGDYKLDNLMFEAALPVRVQAVVDWEQSTIGDPLVDVGWVIGLWTEPGDRGALAGPSPLGASAPARVELIDRYAGATGRDLTELPFYCVLGLFKLACVMEGSYARFSAGTSDDAFFATLSEGVPALARRALEFANGQR
jgi:aminoglycoside phosphotransferase (APT) family kinase protein